MPLQAYLSSDHLSAATGKTIAITISKNGAAYGNPSGGATNATEIGSGSYYVDLTTTDTGTVGPIFVLGTVSGVDPVIEIYNVVKATNGGWTALPDTACTTNGSLLTSGTGAAQITNSSGLVTATLSGDLTSTMKTSVTTACTASTPTVAAVSGAVGSVTGNIGGISGVTIPATIASPTNITAGTITTVTNLTNAPTAGDFTATMKTSLSAATPAVTVSDKTGFSLTSAYDPAKTASQAGDAMALTSGERNSTADALLNRNMSLVTVTNSRSPINALRAIRNKSSISGGTYTVTTEDDSTTAWTGTVSTDAGALPITGLDPA